VSSLIRERVGDGDKSWVAQEWRSAWRFLEGTPVRREEQEGTPLPVSCHAKRALPAPWRAEHWTENAGGIRTAPRGTDHPRVLYPGSETCASRGPREQQAATSLADESVKLLERTARRDGLHGWCPRELREPSGRLKRRPSRVVSNRLRQQPATLTYELRGCRFRAKYHRPRMHRLKHVGKAVGAAKLGEDRSHHKVSTGRNLDEAQSVGGT